MRWVIMLLGIFLWVTARAASGDSIVASDNAANPAYNSGWTAGTNGGFGFGAWSFGGSGSAFLGNSSSNGNGDSTGDINTPQNSSGRAWGLETSSGLFFAARSFTSSLGVGQTFHIDFDTGFVATNGGLVALDLSGASNTTTLLGFGYQQGSSGDYYMVDGSNIRRDTGVAFTDKGVNFAITLTSNYTYSAAITPLGGSTTVISGSFAVPGTIAGLDFVATENGTQPQNAVYYNNIAISSPVPLPNAGFAGGALLILLGATRGIRRFGLQHT